MLVTDVGGLAEIVPHMQAGYVVQPNVEAIALAIKDFYDNNRQPSFEAFVKNEKQKYAWSKMVKAIESVM